jgi:transcriptional regulator with XRE-family HTH domain
MSDQPRPIALKVGSYIGANRHRKGLSQQELGDRIKRSRVSVAQIEAGIQLPPLDTLYAIAEALGVEVYDLLPTRRQAKA